MQQEGSGLVFTRFFTTNTQHPFDTIEWETRDAVIKKDNGEVVFEQRYVEVPKSWSQTATNIVASKYFRGQLNTQKRERSVKQLLERVARTIRQWGIDGGYFFPPESADIFYEEILHLMVNQMMLPNSPVLFNLGWEGRKQAVSACYITAAEDTMESILDLYKIEGMIFRDGSGAGSNLSSLRSSKEGISAGGKSSGPIGFMRGLDANAGSIASGGSTRRAALLRCLNADHPDIFEFVNCKSDAEKKAHALIDAGFDPNFNVAYGAYDSVHFQNANISVRVTDAFMQAVENDEDWKLKSVKTGEVLEVIKARKLFREIAESAHFCADPGIMFHDEINKWNGVKESGEYVSTNPCFAGNTRIATTAGLIPISELVESGTQGEFPQLITKDGVVSEASRLMVTGYNPIWEVTLSDGRVLRVTPNHNWLILEDGKFTKVQTSELQSGMVVSGLSKTEIPHIGNSLIPADVSLQKYTRKNVREISSTIPEKWTEEFALILGDLVGNGAFSTSSSTVIWIFGTHEDQRNILANRVHSWLSSHLSCVVNIGEVGNGCVQVRVSRYQFTDFLKELGFSDAKAHNKIVPEAIYRAPLNIIASFLKGYFGADGTVYGKSEDGSVAVNCSSASLELLRGIQQLLDLFGIRSKISLMKEGGSEEFYYNAKDGERRSYISKTSYRLNIVAQDIGKFSEHIGFSVNYKEKKLNELLAARKVVSNLEHKHILTIEKIEDLGIKELTYNLTEPINHAVFANGVYIAQCGEFHMLNWASCNLASLNLLKFLNPNGTFDVNAFMVAVSLTATMQEIAISGADFPTEKIAQTSRDFRPIGIGYANLGAILMAKGLPYDSEEGREFAKGVTAVLTGAAFYQSALIARFCTGPFPTYPANRNHMLRKVSGYYQKTNSLKDGELKERAFYIWGQAYQMGERFGFRNCEVSCAAPTGCVTLDTLTLTSRGLLPIGTLGDLSGSQWQDVNFSVAQESKWTESNKFFINGEKPIFRLLTERGHSLRATPNHQIRVIDQNGNYIWKRMDEIRPGDYVVTRIGGHEEMLENAPYVSLLPIDSYDRLPKELNENLAELLGFYMGNGYAKATGGLHLVFNEEDASVDRRLSLFCEEYGFRRTEERRDGCYIVNFNGRDWLPWLEKNGLKKDSGNLGEGAASAFIPLAILQSRTSVLAGFLRGLFTADGTVTENTGGTPTIEFSTVSEVLANQVHVALEALGIRANHRIQEKDKNSFGVRPLHRIRLTSIFDAWLFQNKVNFLPGRKQGKLSGLLAESSYISSRGDCIHHQSLLDDLYDTSKGLPHYVRSDILQRKYEGKFNTEWAKRLIVEYPQLGTSQISSLFSLGSLRFVRIVSCEENGNDFTVDISVPENNTYIANGLISHNTIAMGMDCATTGIEPSIALVAYKKLVGGGTMKLVNDTVIKGLQRLGYSDGHIEKMIEHIDEHGNVANCPYLKEEDLPVFDCALGERAISPLGHLKMVAAVQEFFSMGVSKTTNIPEQSTVEDIEAIYREAWKLKIKAVSVYRDGCKRSQPLNVKNPTGIEKVVSKSTAFTATGVPEVISISPIRRKLPNDRQALCHKFSIAGHEGYIHVGFYEDGTPGEVFVRMAKEGSTISGLMDSISTMVSLGLQYGIPLSSMVDKFSHTRFEPSGFTQNSQIPYAKSLTDYLFRFLGEKFLPKPASQPSPPTTELVHATPSVSEVDSNAPICSDCGSLMVRNGACHVCPVCASTSGCS